MKLLAQQRAATPEGLLSAARIGAPVPELVERAKGQPAALAAALQLATLDGTGSGDLAAQHIEAALRWATHSGNQHRWTGLIARRR